jgi:hypothetical protein
MAKRTSARETISVDEKTIRDLLFASVISWALLFVVFAILNYVIAS